jgi:non-ribosomal peptide synthetase component F/thioesterase domain-containing protein
VVRLVKGVDYARLGADEVFLQFAPISFDASTFEIWAPLLNGARLVLFPDRPASLDELGDVILSHGVTTLWLTAGLFHQMVDHLLHALRNVRQLLAGGDVLSAQHVRIASRALRDCTIINGYGPTENTTFSCCYPVRNPEFLGERVPIGKPVSNSTAFILDERMNPVPVGKSGELFLGGDGLARGYFGRADLTAERFVRSPFAETADERLYKTGDRARYLPDGNIEFLGRLDDQVKVRGYRIELGEIDVVLSRHPDVSEALTLVHGSRADEKQLIAYFVPREGASVDGRDLKRYLAERLPHYMVPSSVVMRVSFPLTPNGKVDREALQSGGIGRDRDTPRVDPKNETERVIAGIFCRALGIETVGTDAGFFDLGGHSLLAVRVLGEVQERFGASVPISAFFRTPTVTGLADEVLQCGTGGDREARIGPALRNRDIPLSSAQHAVAYICALNPAGIAYNFQARIRMRGAPDVDALSMALDEIVRRHDILRTSFHCVRGDYVMRVHSRDEQRVPRLRVLRTGGIDDSAAVRAELTYRFDLASLPLVRWTLVDRGSNQCELLLVEHHIVHDGWSFGVFLSELQEFYNAFAAGSSPRVSKEPLQFADYAARETSRLQGALLKNLCDYWRGQLSRPLPAMDLPLKGVRPRTQSFRGDEIVADVSPDLADRLRSLARTEHASLFAVMLSAFSVLLGRATGLDDIIVGSGFANRHDPQTHAMLGMFVNTLPLRVDLSGDPVFKELLGRVRATVEGAFQHEELPFEQIVRLAGAAPDSSRNPLTPILFSFHDSRVPRLGLRGLDCTLEYLHNGSSKVDMSVIAMPWKEQQAGLGADRSPEGIALRWEYATDLFERDTVRRLVDRYMSLLAYFAANPQDRLSSAWDAEPHAGDTKEVRHVRAGGVSMGPPGNAEDLMSPTSCAAVERELIEMWEEILGVRPVRADDNFFDLGGHSLQALRLFSLISEKYAVRFPLSVLFEAPSVRALARRISQGTLESPAPRIVAVNGHGSLPPFFCVHGGGGGVLRFNELARELGEDQPFYAIRMMENDLQDPGFSTIEGMAHTYVRELRNLHPAGPYYLGGFCIGGLIALEMARSLEASGERVGLLVFMESRRNLLMPGSGGVFRFTARHLHNLSSLSWRERVLYLRHRVLNLAGRTEIKKALKADSTNVRVPVSVRMLRRSLELVPLYAPSSYGGRCLVVEVRRSGYDSRQAWTSILTGSVEYCVLPGLHENLFQRPRVAVLASVLRKALFCAR